MVEASSRALLFLSNRVSRRDVGTQLALVQYYAKKEDAPRAMYHYDSAMRVSSDVEPVLFPILAGTLEARNIQLALAPSIRRSPRWLPNFIYFIIGSGNNSGNLANAIMVAGGLPKQPDLYRNLETQILGALANARDFEVLQAYYLSLKGADISVFKSASFSNANTDPRYVPLAWQAYATPSVSTTMEYSGNARQKGMSIQVSSGERAIAASKLLFLASGKTLVSINYEFSEPGSDASTKFTLECLDADLPKTIWQLEIKATPGANEAQSVASVPEKCAVQNLTINAAGGTASQGMQMHVVGISLKQSG